MRQEQVLACYTLQARGLSVCVCVCPQVGVSTVGGQAAIGGAGGSGPHWPEKLLKALVEVGAVFGLNVGLSAEPGADWFCSAATEAAQAAAMRPSSRFSPGDVNTSGLN